jgi:hypothetical protein
MEFCDGECQIQLQVDALISERGRYARTNALRLIKRAPTSSLVDDASPRR